MLQEKHRKILVVSFIVGIILILAIVNSSWNAFANEKDKLGVLPALFAFLAIIVFGYLFRIAYRISDVQAINKQIEEEVALSRTNLLKEIQKAEENKKEKETTVDDVSDLAKAIIPSGKFKSLETFSKKLLNNLAKELNLVQGIVYITDKKAQDFTYCVGYAIDIDIEPSGFKLGENLNGEAAKSKELLVVEEIPENYFTIESGLGQARPGYLFILPIISNEKTIAVIELASFSELTEKKKRVLEQASELISNKLTQLEKA